MPDLGPWEIVIILVVLVVLFGSKKLPDAARSIGRSARIFKAETKGLRNDGGDDDTPAATEEAPKPVTTTGSDSVLATRELELRERELALKEREHELKAQQSSPAKQL